MKGYRIWRTLQVYLVRNKIKLGYREGKQKVEAEVCSNFNPIRNKKFTQNLYKKRLRGSNLLFYPYNIVYDFDVFKI